jgi:hypothetical protein
MDSDAVAGFVEIPERHTPAQRNSDQLAVGG